MSTDPELVLYVLGITNVVFGVAIIGLRVRVSRIEGHLEAHSRRNHPGGRGL